MKIGEVFFRNSAVLMACTVLSTALTFQSCKHQQNSGFVLSENEKQFLKQWRIESTTQDSSDGSTISTAGFNDSAWVKAEVPTSVLNALVKAGIYPDPHFNLNDLQIPDACDTFNEKMGLAKYSHIKGVDNPFKDPYWFRTTFRIPAEKKGKRVWLNFDGINYRADVWLNSKQIASSTDMAGMFRRFQYDISDQVNFEGQNVLAVKIHQVDHVGTPNPGYQFEVFGPSRGWAEDIFKDVTIKFMAGWDCAPVVRDRNMGLYQDVFLTYSGDVTIVDPYIITDLPLPDTTKAEIYISAGLKNSGTIAQKGVLRGSIDMLKVIDFCTYKKEMPGNMNTVTFEKAIEIPAGQTVKVSFSPKDFKQLTIKNPHLWWPNGYGKQYLHNLNLTFETNGTSSDVKNTTFGIRELGSTLKELNGEFGRVFLVNGQRVFCRGGWIQPDMVLDMSKKRMYDEARLLAESGVNMIANEDMPAPPEYVMETYDKYGLMMWETFYQCWTSYPGTETFNNPVDTKLSLENSFDIVKRYRNHPSLTIWAMQCETMIREDLYVPLRKYIKEHDTTRIFIASSSIGWDVDKLTPYIKPDLPTGMTDEGPPDYTWYPHDYYYRKVLEVKDQMFRNEMGVPAVSTLGSMKKYIFDLGSGPKDSLYPLDKAWAYHDAVDGDDDIYSTYDNAIRSQYGQPQTVEDYLRWAQYVNAGSYRAMFEAANHRMWDITSGVMIWKLNAVWPQVLWQIYDWFLNPNAAYYYTKKALEPLHIQLNELDYTVSVINTRHKSHKNLTAIVKVFNLDMTEQWHKEQKFTIEADRYKELFKIPELQGLNLAYFVRLQLKNNKGDVVSDNLYWLSSNKEQVDLRAIAGLSKTELDISHVIKSDGEEYMVIARIKNNSNKVSFFNRFMITKGEGGDEVWPTFWSDNFVTLFPGEEKVLTARFAKQDLDGKEAMMVLDKDF